MNANAIFAKQELFSYEKTAGDLLRETREVKGLSQESVASSLNLMISHVIALESDRYNPDLEGKHFAQYIKSYADLLELNPDIVLALYESINHSPLKALTQVSRATAEKAVHVEKPAYSQFDTTSSSAASTGRNSSGFISRLIAIFSLLFLAWFINRSDLEPRDLLLAAAESMQNAGASIQIYVQEQFPFVELEKGDAPIDMFEQSSGQGSEQAKQEQLLVDSLSEQSSPSERELAQVPTQSALDQALAAPDMLDFIFSSDCWVEVYDENGKQVFMGNNLAGSQLNLSGNGPFEVLIGNSRGVSLRFNGDAVPIKVHQYSDHTRFLVSPNGVRVITQDVFSAAFENFKAEQLGRESSGVKVSISEENFQAYRLDVVDSASTEDVLLFQFSSDCWVEVYDKQQQPIVMETKQAGQTLRVAGEAPFEVRVGNSRAVELTLNGQSVNIKQHPEIDSTELVVGQR